tara:strand:+ start:2033 stop:2782 length:750 start_codon:yes stop_codon:yes gene_type:complete
MDYKEILGLRTDDPKMDDETYKYNWDILKQLPLFISYPRTGAHWINAVIELYFDAPRLPQVRATFLDPAREDWTWYHDHDTIAWDKLHIQNSNAHGVLYLYRNPVDTVFSWVVYNFNNGRSLSLITPTHLDNLVIAISHQYRDHLTKWLIETEKTTCIRYENFKKDPLLEFKKVMKYWEREQFFDEELAQSCFNVVTPEELSKRKTEPNTLSDFMLTDEYKKDRSCFIEAYKDRINSIVITDDLKRFFE